MSEPSKPVSQRRLSIVFAALALLANIYFWQTPTAGKPVVLTHGPQSIRVGTNMTMLDVVRSCPSLYGSNARYSGTWWLPSGHAQTMWNTIGDHTLTDVIPYHRRYLRVPDNGTLVLDTYPPLHEDEEGRADDTPIVVILHGITGSSQESYTRATVNALSRPKEEGGPGFRTVVLNFRGCDGTPVTSSRLYHAGETDDFRSVLLFLTQTFPLAPLYAVGFSMGASTLAVYLGQQGENTPIKAAVCVSNPWDWVKAAHWIENGSFMNRWVYGPVLADALRTIFHRNLHAFQDAHRTFGIDIPPVLAKWWFTIRWYDDRVTSKMFGFTDAWDYYTQTSSVGYMPAIRTPLLSLHSTDDPIIAGHNMPWAEVLETDSIVFASTHGGGHVGWFESGTGGFLKRWYTTPVVEFFENFHKIDPMPKLSPPVMSADDNGLVFQAGLPHVGYMSIEGESYTGTGRSIQGF